MKKGIKLLFKDFFWIFAWLLIRSLILTLGYFKIEIPNIHVMAILLDFLVCFFFFLAYKLTVAKLFFPKNICIKCIFLLKLFSFIIVINFFYVILLVYFPEFRNTHENYINELSLIYMIGAVFIGPFAEELTFRYHIYTSMKNRYQSKLISSIISSFLFAYLHKFNTGYATTVLITIFFRSLIYTYAYEKTGSILSSIILHACNNAYSIAYNKVVDYRYGPYLFFILTAISFIILLVLLIVFVMRKILARTHRVPQCDSMDLHLSDTATTLTEIAPSTTIEKAQIETEF